MLKGLLSSAVFSPSGGTVLTSSGDCTACLFDAETEQCLCTFTGHEDGSFSCLFVLHSKYIGLSVKKLAEHVAGGAAFCYISACGRHQHR